MDAWDGLRRRWAAIPPTVAIHITAPRQDAASVRATEDLLSELMAPGDAVTVHWHVDMKSPGLVIRCSRDHHTGPISFWGTPSGYELEGLLYALERLAFGPRTPTPFSAPHTELIRQIERPLAIDLYVAPT